MEKEHTVQEIRCRSVVAGLLLLGLGSWGCDTPRSTEGSKPQAAPFEAETDERPQIVVLGDSITAGHGIPVDQAFPAVIQRHLDSEGYAFQVVNAGVSGDTTAGGLRRLDWVLEGDVRVLVLALGGNDGLRGLPVEEMKRNLEEMISRARARGIAVLLAGMEAPPNHGEHYTSPFRRAFRELAEEHEIAFMPFLLQDVGGVAGFNQADGIHPNTEGARIIAGNIWTHLKPLLEAAR